MTLENLSGLNGIFVEDSERYYYERNGLYQSDFEISMNGCKRKVTVWTNQPIYCDNGKLELPPKDIANLMCYSQFMVKKIIYHDKGPSCKAFNEILRSLKNL